MLNSALINVNDIHLVAFTNRDLKPYSCAQLQDNFWFIQFTSERQAYTIFLVHKFVLRITHLCTYTHLINYCKFYVPFYERGPTFLKCDIVELDHMQYWSCSCNISTNSMPFIFIKCSYRQSLFEASKKAFEAKRKKEIHFFVMVYISISILILVQIVTCAKNIIYN